MYFTIKDNTTLKPHLDKPSKANMKFEPQIDQNRYVRKNFGGKNNHILNIFHF